MENYSPLFFFFFPTAKTVSKYGTEFAALMCHLTEEVIYHQVKFLCKCLLTSTAIIFCGTDC